MKSSLLHQGQLNLLASHVYCVLSILVLVSLEEQNMKSTTEEKRIKLTMTKNIIDHCKITTYNQIQQFNEIKVLAFNFCDNGVNGGPIQSTMGDDI